MHQRCEICQYCLHWQSFYAGFFELRDQYRFIQNPDGSTRSVTDLPTAFVTITAGGRSKRVEDYIGAPEGLKQLARQIDGLTRTKRWILLDEPMLAQLAREGWTPSSEELADLLRKAVQQDEVAVVKGLLDRGGDPNGMYFGTNTPLLMMVRSAATTRMLLAAGANPFIKNDYGMTALDSSARGCRRTPFGGWCQSRHIRRRQVGSGMCTDITGGGAIAAAVSLRAHGTTTIRPRFRPRDRSAGAGDLVETVGSMMTRTRLDVPCTSAVTGLLLDHSTIRLLESSAVLAGRGDCGETGGESVAKLPA